MITLFNDKNQTFECKLKVEGSKYKTIIPRLVLKDGEKSIFFEGKVDLEKCIIEIPPLSEIGQSGEVVLEILVDDALFNPYKSKYEIISSANKVVAEEINLENKPVLVENGEKKILTESVKKKYIKKKKSIFKENIAKHDKKVAEEMLSAYGGLTNMHRKLLKGHVTEVYQPTKKSKEWAEKIFAEPNSIVAKVCMYEYDNIGAEPEINKKKSLYRQMLGN